MATIHEHERAVSQLLGSRLHAMRESREWTLETLAERTELSKAYLSRIESGERQPSIGVLCAIAKAFGVSIATLFEQPDEVSECVIVRQGSGSPKPVNGLQYVPLSSSTKPFNLQPIGVIIPAERSGRETYQHDGEEWIHVLEGRVRLSIEGKRHFLETGDSAHFDSRLAHRLDALNGKPARIVLVACSIPVALNPTPRRAAMAGQLVG